MAIIKASTISRRKSLKRPSSSSSLNSQSTVSQPRRKSSLLSKSPNPAVHKDSSPANAAAADHHTIKALLKQYKKLELALSKFNSKTHSITKANILRTTLLPFLRLLPNLDVVFTPNLDINLSFCSVSTAVLGKWWRCLLDCLCSSSLHLHVSSTDRNAYLECVSRIVALPEWNSADHDASSVFTLCLTDTLDFCVRKLQSLKIVPISMSAFVGKIFAYSFYYLPHVCNALLFLLNVKQSEADDLLAKLKKPCSADIASASEAFPHTVAHLINYSGVEGLPKWKRSVINSIPPPKHPVNGIRDPSGAWVRRWSRSDSDIFNSFFRHYISIADRFLSKAAVNRELDPAVFPGFSIIASHIYQIFSVSVTRILQNLTKPENPSSAPLPRQLSYGQAPLAAAADPTVNQFPAFPFKLTDSNYLCIIKLLKTSRDISFASIPCAGNLAGYIDGLLIALARSVTVYDCNKNGILLNLVYLHSNHVFDTTTIDWEFWLGCVTLMLTKTHHVQIILKSFAFLFNVWDRIPNYICRAEQPQKVSYLKEWLVHPDDSVKLNFSKWLTSSLSWFEFFLHWNPIVRSYYLRLLSWRVIGVNNFETSASLLTTRRVRDKLTIMLSALSTHCQEIDGYNFSPDHPMVNRKISIIPMNPNLNVINPAFLATPMNVTHTSDMRKTHPYEVFDEAVYSCTSLPSSPSQQPTRSNVSNETSQKVQKNASLINSLSKFFKSLSTDEGKDGREIAISPPKLLNGRNLPMISKKNSSLSLTTSPLSKSRASTPSILSQQSSINSNTDFSATSSMTSEDESSMSDFIGSSSSSSSSSSSTSSEPPELFKVPPEIVPPMFRFEIVVDQENLSNKFTEMQKGNGRQASGKFYMRNGKGNSTWDRPNAVKIPSISIFVTQDLYNQVHISNENFLMEEDVYDEEEEKEKSVFEKELKARISRGCSWGHVGRSVNEWNGVVDEFEQFLFKKVEADREHVAFTIPGEDPSDGAVTRCSERDYLRQIIPFFPNDSYTEAKVLNAS